MHEIQRLHRPAEALVAQTARHSEAGPSHERGATGGAGSRPVSGELAGLPQRTPRPAADLVLPLQAEAMLAFEERAVAQRRTELEGRRFLAQTMPALAPRETMLAAYLFARAVDCRKVEGDDLANLRKGNDTVLETREALAYGRGNVFTDIRASNHESSRRVEVGREITDHLKKQHEDFGTAPAAAAVAMFVGAGNCEEHANVAASLHLAKLRETESTRHMTLEGLDHAWSEFHTDKPRDHDTRDHDVVMDPWAEGPAIFAPDGTFARTQEKLSVVHAYSASEAYAVSESIKETKQQLEEHPPVNLDTRLDELRREGYRLQRKNVWAPTHVLAKSFARRVSKKLGKKASTSSAKLPRLVRSLVGLFQKKRPPTAALLDDIRAVGVARSLGGSVKTAKTDAPAIIDAAKDLMRAAKRRWWIQTRF